jgi:arylsulfatase A-like enzyme
LAEILKESGYYCVGFCCNPRLDQEHGFAQGFDLYDDYSVPIMLQSLTFGYEQASEINEQRTNGLINDAAIGWLQNNTHKPFFMFLHYYDNHWDYLPPSPYDTLYDGNYDGPIDGTEIAREPLFSNPPNERDIQHIVALYDGEIKQTDHDLGEMLKYLKDRGLFDSSIVIILGDHGEQFYEHGHTSHHGVYEELIHIPLALSIPGPGPRSKTVDSLVSQVDVLPTILDFLRIPIPDACQGRSIKPVIEGESEAVNEFVFAEYTGGAVPDCHTVRSARYKYYQVAGDEQFAYDLTKDPGERHRIPVADFPEEVRMLRRRLEQLMSK